MKATVKIEKEVEIKWVLIDIHCRYVGSDVDSDVPPDFPLLDGEEWRAKIEVDTGQIIGWPDDAGARSLFTKVCDEGIYALLDIDGNEVAKFSGYVPNKLVPGEYGDYVDLKIDESGLITNWPSKPDVSEFFESDD